MKVGITVALALFAGLVAALAAREADPTTGSLPVDLQGTRLDEKPALPTPGPLGPLSPSPAASPVPEGTIAAGFDVLSSYAFTLPDPTLPESEAIEKTLAQIPEDVRGLTGKRVLVKGFMMPSKGEDGKITEFYLLRYQPACCFGDAIKMNEWIEVKMKKGTFATYNVYTPITVAGILEVNPSMTPEGYLSGIYRMEGHEAP